MRHTTSSTATPASEGETSHLMEDLKHPLRMRIVGLLAGASGGRTQSEIGKALSLSNAAVHYHIKLLASLAVIHLVSTRPGPNGIVEKLYAVDPRKLDLSAQEKTAFHLDYTLAHMGEMQREGGTLLAADDAGNSTGCVVGCYEAYATPAEIGKLRKKLLTAINEFHQRCKAPRNGARPVAITVGVLPSHGAGWTGTVREIDFGT